MSRLEILKQEREQISQMQCLSFDLMEKCREWYDHEIECIEEQEFHKTVPQEEH